MAYIMACKKAFINGLIGANMEFFGTYHFQYAIFTFSLKVLAIE